jgi:hypothetical protein
MSSQDWELLTLLNLSLEFLKSIVRLCNFSKGTQQVWQNWGKSTEFWL